MDAVFISKRPDEAAFYRDLIAKTIPGFRLHVWPDVPDPAIVDSALAWQPPPDFAARLPALRLLCNLGMGVDYLMEQCALPPDIAIARLVDPNMVEQMAEYAIYGALHFHRLMPAYEALQRERRWDELPLPHTAERRIGVLGMGTIGVDIARKLAALGFPVAGWTATRRSEPGVESFAGDAERAAFLARTDILVCVLPLTPKTRGILDAKAFATLPKGAYVINIARGAHVVESDLLAALDAGQIAGAMLDVVAQEPLLADDPLWSHPRVKITPHIAGLTNPFTAAAQIGENIRRLRAGEPILNRVDARRGY